MRCALCPIKYGAFKKAEDGLRWVHSVSCITRRWLAGLARLWRWSWGAGCTALSCCCSGLMHCCHGPRVLLTLFLRLGHSPVHACPGPRCSQACALWMPETFLSYREVPGVGRQEFVAGLEKVKHDRWVY